MSEQTTDRGLDCDLETFRNDFQKASELVARLYERLDQARITPTLTRAEIASLFDEPLQKLLSRWPPSSAKWRTRSLQTPRCI